jgi:uncharacterized protein (DUF849 family)
MMGLLYADGVRIGLEDNLYSVGKTKTTNMWLLKRISNIKNELGLLLMTPKEFKEMGYGNRKINNIRV